MSTTDKRPAPTSDFCVSCDTHLSEFCWVCQGKMEKQRDDLLAACEALFACMPSKPVVDDLLAACETLFACMPSRPVAGDLLVAQAEKHATAIRLAKEAIANAKRGISKGP